MNMKVRCFFFLHSALNSTSMSTVYANRRKQLPDVDGGVRSGAERRDSNNSPHKVLY